MTSTHLPLLCSSRPPTQAAKWTEAGADPCASGVSPTPGLTGGNFCASTGASYQCWPWRSATRSQAHAAEFFFVVSYIVLDEQVQVRGGAEPRGPPASRRVAVEKMVVVAKLGDDAVVRVAYDAEHCSVRERNGIVARRGVPRTAEPEIVVACERQAARARRGVRRARTRAFALRP
jgi:hypothetical protein